MDQYNAEDTHELVTEDEVDRTKHKVYRTMWVYKIKLKVGTGELDKLNPRWCLMGTEMDRKLYRSRSEQMRMSTFKIVIAIGARYYEQLCKFNTDFSNAFQSTRREKFDKNGKEQPPLYCQQAAGFVKRDSQGRPLICKVKVYLQGSIDATHGFDARTDQLFEKAMFHLTHWDKKLGMYNNTPLKNTDASLTEIIKVASTMEDSPPQQPPHGFSLIGRWVDDGVGTATGNPDPSSNRIVQYFVGCMQETYAVTCTAWRQMLSFKIDCNDTERTVTLSMPNLLNELVEEISKGVLSFTPKHVMSETIFKLETRAPPPVGDPERDDYVVKQRLCRRIVAAMLYLSNGYPKLRTPTVVMAGTMHEPDADEMMKHIRCALLHVHGTPDGIRYGGDNLTPGLEQPDNILYPFTTGVKAAYLEYFSDASLEHKGITGGVAMLGGGSIFEVCQRQHLAAAFSHSGEITAAGSNMHHLMPINGVLQCIHVRLGKATPFWLDSVSTVFSTMGDGSVKKSAWLLRRIDCLHDAVEHDEIYPLYISERDMVADPFTKYLKLQVWARHMWYVLNMKGDPPNAYTVEKARELLDLAYKRKGE